MGITYDEVWISTIREINICKDYIKTYEKEITVLEKELGIKAFEVKEDMLKDKKLARLYKIKCALEREKERLEKLKELLR